MSLTIFSRPFSRLLLAAELVAGAALLAGCESDAHHVCADVTNCSHGGSDDFLTACEAQSDDLAHEATRSGCDSAYNAYFACAEDHFECNGNESTFPSCEAVEAALDRCLAAGRANNACGELDARLADCPADASPGPSDASSEPCTANGACSAQCYLDSLRDVCAPTAAELSAFADCASHCVF